MPAEDSHARWLSVAVQCHSNDLDLDLEPCRPCLLLTAACRCLGTCWYPCQPTSTSLRGELTESGGRKRDGVLWTQPHIKLSWYSLS